VIRYTVVGGWLGSGKTTLINRMLESADGERIAVVVNDVGEINIDAGLIRSRGTETIELTNGCVCCSIGGSLAITLRDLVVGDGPGHRPPDRIVVEASGVADPAKVASYGDRRVLRPDGVLVTFDAVDGLRRLADETYGAMVRHQLEGADVIVMTKCDLATADQFVAAHNWCRANLPAVTVVESLDAALASLVDAAPVRVASTAAEVPSQPAPVLSFETRTWRPDGPVDVSMLLDDLAAARIVRAKGVVRDRSGQRCLVQFVDGGEGVAAPTDVDLPEALVLISTAADLDAFLAAVGRAARSY